MSSALSVLVLDPSGCAASEQAQTSLAAIPCQLQFFTCRDELHKHASQCRPDLILLCVDDIDEAMVNFCATLEFCNPEGRIYSVLVAPQPPEDVNALVHSSVVYYRDPPRDLNIFAQQLLLMATTGRKAGVMEAALRDAHMALRALDAASCTVDIASESCIVPPALLRLFELPGSIKKSGDSKVVHWRDLLVGICHEDQETFAQALKQALADGEPVDCEIGLAAKPNVRLRCCSTIRRKPDHQPFLLHLTWHRLLERDESRRTLRLVPENESNEHLLQLDEQIKNVASGSMLFIRIEDFANVCKTLGYLTGQQVLKAVHDRILNDLRDKDAVLRFGAHQDESVARIGGAEFVAVLTEVADDFHLGRIRQRLLQDLRRPIDVEGREVPLKISVGTASWPRDGLSPDDLLVSASIAADQPVTQKREESSKSQQAIHSARDAIRLEADLYDAIINRELKLMYQPKYHLDDGQIAGVEALLRWNRNHDSWVSPEVFIPIAERNGLIGAIGRWVIEEAIATHAKWFDQGLGRVPVAINISPQQLNEAGLVQYLVDCCEQSAAPIECIELEVTESCLADDSDHAVAVLQELSDLGFKIALDDFGTGFSSLSYLRALPLDVLKIDRSFVNSLSDENYDPGLIACIIGLGLTLGLHIVAEGIEEQLQWDMLGEWGCHYGQGYLMSKPISDEEMVQMIKRGHWKDSQARQAG